LTRILEPNKLKMWILRAVLEGNETSKDIYDYVSSCGYCGTEKAVMMDLKRYADHSIIHREKVEGKYRYRPARIKLTFITILTNGKTSLLNLQLRWRKN
jgi:predicted transcriptional regulator